MQGCWSAGGEGWVGAGTESAVGGAAGGVLLDWKEEGEPGEMVSLPRRAL